MSVYEALGVEPIINAVGPVTRLGGAPMPAEVVEAFVQASQASVPVERLLEIASRRIADATGTEAGLVTAGAAASLTLGASAILAGNDCARMERLPHTDGFPNEFIVAREHRSGYDHAVRAAGARLVEIGYDEIASGAGVRRAEAWEYEAAFGPNTAGVLFCLSGSDAHRQLEAVVDRAHRGGFPVLVDAAAELPPRSNLRYVPGTGADLVAFSGGKAIRGPQSTGILCGRRELVGSAALQWLDLDEHPDLWEPPASLIDKRSLSGMPRHGIGRSMKVSIEEIAALLKALELFESGSLDADIARQREALDRLKKLLLAQPVGLRILNENADGFPELEIALPGRWRGRAMEICQRLMTDSPAIYLGRRGLRENRLYVHALRLTMADIETIAARLVDEFVRS